MKVLVCINTSKDLMGESRKTLVNALEKYSLEYDIVTANDQIKSNDYDVLFIIGGDGTILQYVEFANINKIPIISINAGKLGFLTEFEYEDIENSVSLFINGTLVKDERSTLKYENNDKAFYALNDIVVQRIYTDKQGMLVSVNVYLDDTLIDGITGDGVIVNTPTGSTAYSLSVGGSILAPGINAFAVTPIASHSFNQRPVIFSSDKTCKLVYQKGTSAGIFVDGKFICSLRENDEITIKKAENPTIFLRKKDSDFFKRLTEKMKYRAGNL